MERKLKLNLDSKGIRSGLNVVDGALKKTQKAGKDTAKMISQAFAKAAKGIAVAGTATAAVLTAIIVKTLAAGDALAKTADKIGITTDALATLNYQAELFTNAGGKSMAEALVKATKRLGEFNTTGGGAAAIWLKQLNLDTQELAAMKPEEVFNKYAESIRGLNSRGEQLAAISALMGDESRALIGIIDASGEALAKAASDAEIFGVNLSRVDAAKMEQVNDATTRVGALFEGFANKLTTGLAPALSAVINLFVDNAKEAGGFGDAGTKVADALIDAFGFVADAGQQIGRVFTGVQFAIAAAAEGILKTLRSIVRGYVEINNALPFTDHMDDFTALDGAINGASDAVDKYTAALIAARDAQPASSQLNELYNKEKASAEQAASDVQGRNDNVAAGPGYETVENTGGSFNSEQAASQLEALTQSLLSEEERLAESFERRSFMVEEAFQNGLVNDMARQELVLGLEAQFQDQRTALAQKQANDERAVLNGKLNMTRSVLGRVGALIGKEGEKMSKKQKILAKVAIGVSTAQAIMNALAVPPYPLGVSLAVLAAAEGAKQLSAVGGSGSSGGGNIGMAPVSAAPSVSAPQIATPVQTTAERGETVIQLQGNFYGWNDEVIDEIVGGISAAVEDRDVRLISPTSRNGQDLATGT